MTVEHLWLNGSLVDLDTGKKSPGWEDLSKVACLCSNAEFKPEDLVKPVVERELVGDATEQGILKCYESIEENSEEIRQQNPKMIGIPFNSRNKYQASVHLMEDGTHRLVMKGAPEIVFSRCYILILSPSILLFRCDTILLEGKRVALTQKIKETSL